MKHSKLLIALGLLLTACGAIADSSQLLERLRVNQSAKVAAEQDFHERRERGSLSGTEAADYAAYVARLHRLVAEDCMALTGAGLPQPQDLGCPSQPTSWLAPAAIDHASEQTLDEQIAVLDAELSAGLGEFDELLLREQERVRAAVPMSAAAGGGGNGGGSEGDTGASAGAAGEPGESVPESDDGSEGSSSRGSGAGSGARRQGSGQGTTANIPDGSDDDVVARQLREAAEKETDPELKKKLWEEYRKYKAGTR